jgi:hypothetical protein
MKALATSRSLVLATLVALGALGGGIALGASRGSGSAAKARYSIEIQAIYTKAGNPFVGANFSPDGGLASPRWSICRPPNVSVCTPAETRGESLSPGPTPVGTVFEATATYKGHVYVARSATWLGTLHSSATPRLSGRARYRASVAAMRGSWSGGWQSDPAYKPPAGAFSGGRGRSFDDVNIEACETRTAQACVNLSPPGKFLEFSKRPVILGSAITGRYLFAFDQRYSPDAAFAGVGYLNPASVPVVHAGATVARSVALGPVIGPPRPTVTIIRTARPHGGQVPITRIRCTTPCRVLATASSTHHVNTVRRTVHGTSLVTVPWQASYGNRLEIQLFVGDGPRIEGTTHVRPAQT